MRAKPTDVTGNVGETEVAAKFERLGWGVASNPKHDLGTDLWLMARDKRLFDLGLVVGAQVKSGPSWFRKKKQKRDQSGVVLGWWFTDKDREHVDAWLAHSLPHVIVLHNLDTQVSYWVHVTDDAVKGTGKGAKVLVPIGNTIDEAHRDELLGVAASRRTRGAWEGSAWTGATTIPPASLLRHALSVPRLVAPHLNADHSAPVTPAEAVAMLVQGRLSDLHRRSEQHETIPSLEEAVGSSDWDWRFVGALGERLTAGEHRALADAAADAPDPARRTAAAVVTAATMLEDGLADEALAVLDAALEPDNAAPVDHAWLIVQKARACVEVGRLEEARDLAAQAQSIGATSAQDLTATALAGVAALILFNSAGIARPDVAAVITGADTTAAWWRTQTVSRGLTALTERMYQEWSHDTTVRWTVGDTASSQLLSASLTASYAGDQSTWRHLTGLLAQDGLLRLDRDADPQRAREELETLRLSGSVEEIKQAVRWLGDNGPAEAVTLAAARIDLDTATHTTAPASLTLLERGGDLADQLTADRSVQWLLAALDELATGNEQAAFVQRTRPSYLVDMRLIDTLAGIVPASSEAVQRAVVDRIATLPPQPDQSIATCWARSVHALPDCSWTTAAARRAGAAADSHHAALRTPLLGLAARHDPDIRQRLLDDAASGDLDALGALGDVRALPQDVICVLVEALSGHVRAQIQDAANGLHRGGGHDHGRALVLLNAWHPELADWDPLLELIADPHVATQHKRGAMRDLANGATRLPDGPRSALLKSAQAAAAQPPPSFTGLLGENKDNTGLAAELVAALADKEESPDLELLPALLAGNTDARRSAARIAQRLRGPDNMVALLVLAADQDPGVRTAAAFGLAKLVAAGEGGTAALAATRRAADDPGRPVPEAIAVALTSEPSVQAEAEALLDVLRRHRSARVRQAAAAVAR